MAKESSFDIVSSVDLQEVDNACTQASKEVAQRYDLKDSGSKVSFDRGEGVIALQAPSEFVGGQVTDIVTAKLAKRGVALGAVSWDDFQSASGASVRRNGRLIQGIDKDLARKVSNDIKDYKLKVKTHIEGDKVRVVSASRDTLQEVIKRVSAVDYGQPLQFENYR
ncbi:MAG: YajQ family cyclic di-GMP-binding protein [Eggerthellaceae bacterium]|jgi:uncharacterized protein YajQ (UPF0234 family)|nr:YajQ family cyclic di-GMP-binding protein [Eggerthellaceae bacterium]MCH4221114.1 YajQ family cyclic di-GMP-binding protein [Eggerthellaceae bacterium]